MLDDGVSIMNGMSEIKKWKEFVRHYKTHRCCNTDRRGNDTLAAVNRVVRASKPIAAWFKASGETRLPKEVAERFVKAVEAMEREG